MELTVIITTVKTAAPQTYEPGGVATRQHYLTFVACRLFITVMTGAGHLTPN